MKRYILFDHDGVLVDTEPGYFAANRRALADAGVTLDPEIYQRLMVAGRSCWDLAREAGMTETQVERGRQRRDSYYQAYIREQDIAIPGVEPTLALLATNYRMAIVTTSKRSDFALIHRDPRLIARMEFVLTREEYAHSKPHPEPYLTGLQRFAANPREVVAVEDSARGLHAAIAAGIDCLIVRSEFTRGHDFTGAAGLIDRFEDLPQTLAAMNERSV